MKTLIITFITLTGMFAFGGEIADHHFANGRHSKGVADLPGKSRSFSEVISTNHGITEIGIERTGCYGTCPAYTFIVKNDGTFRYKGEKYVERIGDFTGTISIWEFHELAQFIRDSAFMELQDNYSDMVTDSSTVFTMVVANGKRKTVSNYAGTGPTKLWAMEQCIDKLMEKAKWNDPKIPKK